LLIAFVRRVPICEALLLASAVLGRSADASAPQSQSFRIRIAEDGVYRVTYEQLLAAGMDGPVAADALDMVNRGRRVRLRVEDGADGRFGPGDRIVFIGRHLPGASSHFHDYSPFNVYWLHTRSTADPYRFNAPARASLPSTAESRKPERHLHLERDLLRVAEPARLGVSEPESLWYWMRLTHLASVPARVPIDLSNLDREAGPVSLRLRFRGGSDAASAANLGIPDHVVELALNGHPIGEACWRGRGHHEVAFDDIDAAYIETGSNLLELRVPTRSPGDAGETLVDVVYLDWVEVVFARDARLGSGQERVRLSRDGRDGLLRLVASAHDRALARVEAVRLIGANGMHALLEPRANGGGPDSRLVFEFPVDAADSPLWIVAGGDALRDPDGIELDRPSALADRTEQRDYFIIAHASLVDALRPLADFHHDRGLQTELIDVQDVYDEFNFGIKHPRAIRAFLAHARAHRPEPAASHVLLAGDASWYVKEHAEATPERVRFNERDLVPTWHLPSRDGPAASDTPYVQLDDTTVPAMAIGRFPAATPAEAQAMVDKTLHYMRDSTPGAWRSRIVLASESGRNFPARNEGLAQRARSAGLSVRELLTHDETGERQRSRYRSEFDAGMLLLHFFGHGGRYMWQAAPMHGGSSANLFDMQDLDLLAPSSRLPIVLSMSCATGPFDHPSADSLAEKFVRLPDRGAIAVLAASARNSPSARFTHALFEEILGGGTLGEAVRKAKAAGAHPDMIAYYNLFGDPALVPARP